MVNVFSRITLSYYLVITEDVDIEGEGDKVDGGKTNKDVFGSFTRTLRFNFPGFKRKDQV